MRPQLARISDRCFWSACIVLSPPVAWAVAARGYGIARGEPWLDIALLALAAAAEELLFRGGLQSLLLRRLKPRAFGISSANMVTSLIFACAHLWAHAPWAALGVLPVSLVLGSAYERGGERLAAPIALHLYFNLLLYAATLLLLR